MPFMIVLAQSRLNILCQWCWSAGCSMLWVHSAHITHPSPDVCTHPRFWWKPFSILGFAKSPDFRNKALKSFARTHKEERSYSWSANPNLNLLLSIYLSIMVSFTHSWAQPLQSPADLFLFFSTHMGERMQSSQPLQSPADLFLFFCIHMGERMQSSQPLQRQADISLSLLWHPHGGEDAILTSTSILWFQNLNNPEL